MGRALLVASFVACFCSCSIAGRAMACTCNADSWCNGCCRFRVSMYDKGREAWIRILQEIADQTPGHAKNDEL